MKRILTFILLISFVFLAGAQPRSQWLMHQRESGEYLFDDGTRVSSSLEPSGDSYIWMIEACEDDAVRICNKSTGRYICVDASGKVLMATPNSAEDKAFHWHYGGFDFSTQQNAGWYTVTCEAAPDGTMLCMVDGELANETVDRVNCRSAHWTFKRLNSDIVPYEIDRHSVRESSFLGERTATAVSETSIKSDYHGPDTWTLTKDISSFPKLTVKGNTLIPALYNMALEEMLLDIRPSDNTFCAGALWPDTWTRDAVYSIWFAYSWIMPEVSRRTLEKQTLKNPSEALQDTGSGGSYPISTDRVVWAVAAWEYYLATGDVDWLRQTYEGLSYTAKKDLHIAYDRNVHLFKGETASLDWRKHTYPNWFTNANIGESYSSGTNSLHFFLYRFLSMSGKIIGAPSEEIALWSRIESELKHGINDAFWSEAQGLYKVWLYPEFLGYQASYRVGDMSNGLAAVLGVSSPEQTARIVENYPMYAYGASVLYPSKPDGFSYHNKSIWPVWQTPMLYAAKSIGNDAVTDFLAKTTTRSGAMFLSHKENMTYDTGYDLNTALNSPRQLWSVASYISLVYRVFCGLDMDTDGLSVSPMLPSWVSDEIRLTNFPYRKAKVNLTIKGNGSVVALMKVNGRKVNPGSFKLSPSAEGVYNIEVVVREKDEASGINMVKAGPGECWSPVEPVIRLENKSIFWSEFPACTYTLKGVGVEVKGVHSPFDISSLPDGYYSICAIAPDGKESDLSNPVLKTSYECDYPVDIKDYRATHADSEIEFEVPEDGDYVIWFTGVNGRGPHDVYCTVRSLYLDGADYATIFLEAFGDWNQPTMTNHVILKGLDKGKHVLEIKLNPENKGFDNNMSFNGSNENDWEIRKLTVAAL